MGLFTQDLGYGSGADQGSGFKDHFASTRPRSEQSCMLCCMTVLWDSAWDPVQQCNVLTLPAVWSLRETTLNPDRGSESSESWFSAYVESLYDWLWNHSRIIQLCVCLMVQSKDTVIPFLIPRTGNWYGVKLNTLIKLDFNRTWYMMLWNTKNA